MRVRPRIPPQPDPLALSAEECRAVEGWNKRPPAEQPAPQRQQQDAPG